MTDGMITERRALAVDILEALTDPVFLLDNRSIVSSVNSAARALWPSLADGMPFSFALRYPVLIEAVSAVLAGASEQSVELFERVPVERSFLVRIARLSEASSSEPRFAPTIIVIFRDLTDARRLESMRVDFVANASHELRTPLASLLGFIETLQGSARNDSQAQERFLGIMREQAQRMARLIDDLLSLSRVEMSEHKQPIDRLDFAALVQEMVDMLRPLARERSVEILCQFPQEPVNVVGERDELLRLIENLIENAIKYGQSGGKVEVSIDCASPSNNGHRDVEFAVRDFGPGIAAEYLPRLTERFYRIDVAESRDKGGTGLGLAIVKHILNRHRGRLVVESQLGKGSVFRAILPMLAAGQ